MATRFCALWPCALWLSAWPCEWPCEPALASLAALSSALDAAAAGGLAADIGGGSSVIAYSETHSIEPTSATMAILRGAR